jgi:dethiobiotin synthetase
MWRVGTLVGVTGTGTGIGKTHVARALIEALRALGADVVGWKPVESGVVGERGDDEAQLAAASEPATAPTLRLRAPLSPHLAARREGSPIDPAALAKLREVVLARCEVLVMELAGGLFSPFDDRLDNADWLVGSDARVVVVAPDRLGVLHDTSAVLRAARPLGLTIEAIVLSAPETPDASTGTNAEELRARHAIAAFALPRAPVATLARDPALVGLARRLLG